MKKYITCELCCYDIVDDNGDIMEHECELSVSDIDELIKENK